MRIKKSKIIISTFTLLISLLVITACSSEAQNTNRNNISGVSSISLEAASTEMPETCNGFGELNWG